MSPRRRWQVLLRTPRSLETHRHPASSGAIAAPYGTLGIEAWDACRVGPGATAAPARCLLFLSPTVYRDWVLSTRSVRSDGLPVTLSPRPSQGTNAHYLLKPPTRAARRDHPVHAAAGGVSTLLCPGLGTVVTVIGVVGAENRAFASQWLRPCRRASQRTCRLRRELTQGEGLPLAMIRASATIEARAACVSVVAVSLVASGPSRRWTCPPETWVR